ncbi:phosphatidylserine decarboxylase family protein [Pseudacidobacterium ailaaui]|jgi:phosphatidylserine decarboxylase|uniref:phosphatidylserine decarboxylase family protein n=1 Tax=Pseudacidobacterium ailaaui TaxID=1382359 RepID=UPI00047C93CF|nr:phosphatidylserine decarboxylase family protein [Pseudacidobacterium ailaaui]
MVRDGYYYGFALIAVSVIVYLLTGHWGWAVLPLLLAVFFLWFFRDPERTIPQGEGLVVSPADGKLTAIERIMTPSGERLRLSIFLSVFDVHVNRSPISGVLREVRYQKGLYLNALDPASADKNEQNLAVLDSPEGHEVAFKQIAGLLARRIVFQPKAGDYLERGERVGMIKFGSRVDVLLPVYAELRVKKGDRVQGGSTVLAQLAAFTEDPILAELEVETLV